MDNLWGCVSRRLTANNRLSSCSQVYIVDLVVLPIVVREVNCDEMKQWNMMVMFIIRNEKERLGHWSKDIGASNIFDRIPLGNQNVPIGKETKLVIDPNYQEAFHSYGFYPFSFLTSVCLCFMLWASWWKALGTILWQGDIFYSDYCG